MDNVLTSIILDTRRALKDGTFPVKLRLTFQRKRKYYPTSYKLTEPDFSRTQDVKARGDYKDMQLAFQTIEHDAREVIKKLPVFTFEAFEKKFSSNAARNEVYSTYQQRIAHLKAEGQVGNADCYNCACNSLKAFTQKDLLPFLSVDSDFLKQYEKWMLKNGRSATTISMYLRTLKALFNDVIATGDVNPELYPFGKRKYQVPASKNIKKALTLEDMEKIFLYEPKNEGEARSKDLFLFSYLCHGINITDMARMKYRQIQKDRITFVRAKTERTTRQNLKAIEVLITPEVQSIIDRWGNKPVHQNAYVFPILSDGLSFEKEKANIKQATKTINKYIKRIAAAVKIDRDVTTYFARHTFSTVLKRSGAPIEFISEALGHSNFKTTESYLDSFEDDFKHQYAAQLTAFKSKANNTQ